MIKLVVGKGDGKAGFNFLRFHRLVIVSGCVSILVPLLSTILQKIRWGCQATCPLAVISVRAWNKINP
jgi:hypothetical protein